MDDSLTGKLPEMPQKWSTTDKDVNTFPGFCTKCLLIKCVIFYLSTKVLMIQISSCIGQYDTYEKNIMHCGFDMVYSSVFFALKQA